MRSILVALGVIAMMVTMAKSEEIIREGAGWNQVLVNSPGDETAKLLKGRNYLIEIPDADVNCLVDANGTVIEVRFNKGFKGATSRGIQVGSDEKDLLAAYGEPKQIERMPKAKKLLYPQLGMLFWVADGKVTQIVVYLAKSPKTDS